MNTIQKLVTIDKDNTLLWHQKGVWVSPSGNVITMDPDNGIERNGIPIDGGGGAPPPIPPILTPDKVVIEDGAKHVTISGQDGFIVSQTTGGSTTINDTGVKISFGGTLTLGNATLGAPLLSALQETHNTTTGNLVLGPTKSLVIGDQSLTRDNLVSLAQLNGRVTALESTDGTFNSRLGTVETVLDREELRFTILSGKVDDNGVVATAGIATLDGKVTVLDDKVQVNTSRIAATESASGNAIAAATAANTAATVAQGTADTALATANSAQGIATTARETADSASDFATNAVSVASAAADTAFAAQGTADAAQDIATAAQATAAATQDIATAAQDAAAAAQAAASSAQNDSTLALSAASSAQDAAAAAQAAASSAQNDSTLALSAASSAQTTANAAKDDIVIMKGVDVSFDERITTLENGAGGEPIVLPFYAKTSNIDFGVNNTSINNNTIKIGPSGTLSVGNEAKVILGDNTTISTGTGCTLSMGPAGTLAVGQTTLDEKGLISLGFGGVIKIGNTTTDEDGLKACNRLATMTQVNPTADHKVVLYDPVVTGAMAYSVAPLTGFTNPVWAGAARAFFPDTILGDTSLQKSSLTIDGSVMGKGGIDAANALMSSPSTPFNSALTFLSKDPNGVIHKSLLPSYIAPSNIDFGGGVTIGPVQATALGNLSAPPSDGMSGDYVVYNTSTNKYGYQEKPTFVDNVNKVVGNMGGTGGATEAYLGKQGMTFGSATTFEPLENTCYGSTAVTVVDRTQGTYGQRKRAEFGTNGIVLSNPLATSLDDPSTITLDRAKLALLQRIAAVDVMAVPDVAVTSTQRMLVGDKISGVYSYALAPVIPSYVKPNSLVMGSDPGDITVSKTSVSATASSGLTATFGVNGFKSTFGAAAANISSALITITNGPASASLSSSSITFKNGATTMDLSRSDITNLKNNFVSAANASAITDIDASGSIRFLSGSGVSASAPKKWLSVPSSYSWLKPANITAEKITGTVTETNTFDTGRLLIGYEDALNSVANRSAYLTPNFLRMKNNNAQTDYTPEGITSNLLGSTPDPTFGTGAINLGYRGVGAASALGANANTPYNNPGVDYLTVAKNPGTGGVRYNYLKVSDLVPALNGAVIEPKKSVGAVISPGAGVDARAAVLDAAGLSFPQSGNPLASGVTSAPHDDTTYNSNFMRIGSPQMSQERITVTKNRIGLTDEQNLDCIVIEKNKITVGNYYGRTNIFGGSLSFSSDIFSIEFPGAAVFGETHSRMVNSMYSPMSTMGTKRYSMVIDNSAGSKNFLYNQYIASGSYHRFPLGSPNGNINSKLDLNLFTSGNTIMGIYNDLGVLKANYATFTGSLKVLPFSTYTKLFIDFNFTDALNYFQGGTTRYLFLSNLYSVNDTVKFVRYHRFSTEPTANDTKVFTIAITPCTIVQSSAPENFVQCMLSITSPSSSSYRGVLELIIERPALYDPVVADTVKSTYP